MKKLNFSKENLGISLILILSAILNFANISIEGYGNGYYAAGVKSMTMSLKNFFFVSFDPAGFVTIDKPPLGFMIQAIFAKIFGFNGWSLLLPEALAGVISVWLIYILVKKSFGTIAGLISALCLAVTPVLIATSRNNTLDNLLVVTLLFACLALTKAAEVGKIKYLIISLFILGLGFNIKMLEAYMIAPAFYVTYLLATSISLKKRIIYLAFGTVILFAVSLSWSIIVDLVPATNRPYVGSSTNNSELELIFGHNGLKRLGIGSYAEEGASGPGGSRQNNMMPGGFHGGNGPGMNDPSYGNQNMPNSHDNQGTPNDSDNQQMPNDPGNQEISNNPSEQQRSNNSSGIQNKSGRISNGQNPSGQQMPDMGDGQIPNWGQNGGSDGWNGGPSGGNGGLQGTFGGQLPASIIRLFSKNVLSDQIVWFLPLALFGFIAGVIKENLRLKLDTPQKQSLVLWFTWLIPEFIYFSFTTGLFHPYYLTMMAPPAAALAGIGIKIMYDFYREGGWKSWFLPSAFLVTVLTHGLMLSYFYESIPSLVRIVIIVALLLAFMASVMLIILNLVSMLNPNKTTDDTSNNMNTIENIKLKHVLITAALTGVLVTPFVGSSAAINNKLNETIPCAGLELLSSVESENFGRNMMFENEATNSKLIEFLLKNKTNEKYILAVSSSQSAQNIIIETGEAVMSLGGFSGSDNILTLDKFKELVKNGQIRYVMAGGMGHNSDNEIMSWVTESGTLVPNSEWQDSIEQNTTTSQGKNSSFKDSGRMNNHPTNSTDSNKQNAALGFPNFGRNSGQLYDLKDVAKTLQ